MHIQMQALVGALLGGFVGGNLAGSLVKRLSLTTLGNTATGLAGGAVVVVVFHQRMGIGVSTTLPIDVVGVITHVAAGSLGGAAAMLFVALLCKAVARA